MINKDFFDYCYRFFTNDSAIPKILLLNKTDLCDTFKTKHNKYRMIPYTLGGARNE